MGGIELLITLVFVGLFAYAFGTGKQKRERDKRQIAEYDLAQREGRKPRIL
jgi:cbb3-type cytochrome oxidase subunit 3